MHSELNGDEQGAVNGKFDGLTSEDRYANINSTVVSGLKQVKHHLPDPHQIRLRFFDFAVATGSLAFMQSISEMASEMLDSEVTATRKSAQVFLTKLSDAEEVERAYGKGAMLNLDHPTISRLVVADTPHGRPFIQLEQIGAAARYRMRREQDL